MDGKAQLLLNEGLTYIDKKDFLLALGSFDSFVQLYYTDWIGHYYRGQTLIWLGRFTEAKTEFEIVLRLKNNLAEAYIELGNLSEFKKDYVTAYDRYKEAIKLNTQYTYAYYKMACMDLLLRDPDEAVRYFKKCSKLDPSFPDAYMAQGIITIAKTRDYEEGISLFNQALKIDSTFSPVYFWRGMAYLKQDPNKPDKCINDWDHFLRYNPSNSFVLALRGFLKAEMGDFDEAFANFRRILTNASVSEDKFQGAQTELDKRIDLQFAANYLIKKGYGLDEQAFSYIKAGFCLLLMKQEAKATEYLKKAERITHSSALYLLVALAYEHTGAHSGALNYYSKALELDNDIFDAHKKRSIYLAELKQWEGAYNDIKEMLRIQPDSPIAYKLRGMMKSNQRKYMEAIADLSKFIQTDSSDIEAFHTRALCYSMIHQYEKATPDVKNVLLLNKKNDPFYEKVLHEFKSLNDTLNLVLILRNPPNGLKNPVPFIELAKILVAQKSYQEAKNKIDTSRICIQNLQNGIFINMGFIEEANAILSNLEGQISYHQQNYTNAIKSLTKSINFNQGDVASRYLRAQCYLKLNNTKKAREDLRILKDSNYKNSAHLFDSLH